ncbi:MAG: hypothetical protein IH784_09955 [Bacteroidetes bacterium]|nr:hypothetical protein [Bacteroidota bacterium]
MYRKIFIGFLLLALINFLLGCYSSAWITVPEYNQIEEEDKPDYIYVKTKDNQEYHFSESNFYIENDTLYAKGKEILYNKEKPFDGKIALSDIESIQFEYLNGVTTTLLVLGIVAVPFIVAGIIFIIVGGVK